ncbi:Sas10/Utp3/C1D family-domain-containing protein [Podospora aff. communis PSN243]|uniref:Exosome complex protein n=1 Tax=Podospora aff. communis PSN243 TaxID=3040156 RepID=A0AAV9H223_9PEZI|nr:Sas10/Utp3/C1D family-domain-containing protein [Podospora aff. communis PSN243]
MDVSDITPQLEKLNGDLDNLEEAIKPLLQNMGDIASKLPLLDKAKLYVLVAYAIESLLFSSMRLNGVDAKDHAIFKELTRVKQYFDKIQKIEKGSEERETKLNTQAAARFIRADLADNKAIKEGLTAMIKEREARAAAQASKAEKKRPADESVKPAESSESKRQKKKKR